MDVREKLVELLSQIQSYGVKQGSHVTHQEGKTNREIASYLIAHGVTVQEWISVKDRLPEGECLAVSMITGPAYEEMLIGYVAEASKWDTGYECESDGEILPNVTHWMPLPKLPQPPKGE